MPIEVTPRALDVLRRGLALARLNATSFGVRVSEARGPHGMEARTVFADEAESGEQTFELGGITLYVPIELAESNATIDVADEHDRIVIRRRDEDKDGHSDIA